MLRSLLAFVFSTLLFVLPARAAGDLKVLMWSDYIDPELPKAFEAKTGTKVQIDVYEETEAMLAKLQAAGGAGSGYDVVVASDHSIPVLVKLNLIQKLDLAKIPNGKNVDARFVRPAYDPKGEYSQPYQWGTVGVIYNKKTLGEIKPSWGSVLGRERKGKLLLLDSPRDTLGAALKFAGHSVNTTDTKQLQEAGKALLEVKKSDDFLGFDGSVSAAKRVVTGQADLALAYNGDALNAIKESKTPEDYEYMVPAEGSIIWVDTMVIPAGAKNLEGAHQFVDFILDAENGAKLSNYVNFASPNAASMSAIEKAARENPRIYPTEAQMKTLQYLEDVKDATRLYDAVWTAVKAR